MLSDKRLYNSTTSKHGTINFITFYHKLFITIYYVAIYYLITHECGICVFTYLYLFVLFIEISIPHGPIFVQGELLWICNGLHVKMHSIKQKQIRFIA